MLVEKARTERVDGPEESPIELAQGTIVSACDIDITGSLAHPLFEPELEPFAKLVRRLSSEGDSGDVLDGRALSDQCNHSVDERRRLSRSCPSFHQHVRGQIAHDAITRWLIAFGRHVGRS